MSESKLRPRVGVSACLVGDAVRYDGRDRADRFLVEGLGRYVDWVRVCPEVELGLGVPRPKIHLVAAEDGTRMIQGERDLTETMRDLAKKRVASLRSLGLHGYVTKTRSPSCGLTDVEVRSPEGMRRDGVGHFARALRSAWPDLPICEESALEDPARREALTAAIFLLHRWEHRGAGLSNLRRFHARHRLFWIWRGADFTEHWEHRWKGEVADSGELEALYRSWMLERLLRPADEAGVHAVAEWAGCRISPRQGLAALLHDLRQQLYDARPDLRPDRFFDPYPPDLGFV